MTTRTSIPLLTTLIALAALAAGCATRAHLTENHGRAMRAAFSAQAVNPEAGQRAHPLAGLDAQEASIVVKNYHRALTAKGSQNDDQSMILLAPPANNQQPYLPPPSVPQEKR